MDKDLNSGTLGRAIGIGGENFLESVVKPVMKKVDKQFSRWFRGGSKLKVKDSDSNKIKEIIEPLINDFNDQCVLKRNELIKNKKK